MKEIVKIGPWIQQAVFAGGIFTVKRKSWRFEASVMWPLQEVEPIEEVAASILEAVDLLEASLQEDAANEMVEQGVV